MVMYAQERRDLIHIVTNNFLILLPFTFGTSRCYISLLPAQDFILLNSNLPASERYIGTIQMLSSLTGNSGSFNMCESVVQLVTILLVTSFDRSPPVGKPSV